MINAKTAPHSTEVRRGISRETCTTHVRHVRDSHVRHVRVSHVPHVRGTFAGAKVIAIRNVCWSHFSP